MILYPNAKINLGLSITSKRQDGFHDLETCFYPIYWSDQLEISTAPEMEFSASGKQIDNNVGDNLCIKAYNVLKKDFDLPPVKFQLRKNIPIGAGLGGGSANAAFTLKGLDELFQLSIENEKLKSYAAQLGSDCSFFIENNPQLATGRGDVLQPIDVSLKGMHIIVIFPNIFISTADAFASVVPYTPENNLQEVLLGSKSNWKDDLVNDFETSIDAKFPVIKSIKESLYKNGAFYAAMSGSGSAVYGLFNEKVDTSIFEEVGYSVWSEQFTI